MGPYLFFCSIVVIPCVVYLIYSYKHTNKNNIMDSDKKLLGYPHSHLKSVLLAKNQI